MSAEAGPSADRATIDDAERSTHRSRFKRRKEAWERLDMRTALRFVLAALWRHPWALSGSIVMGFLIAAASLLSVSLILPFIHSLAPESGGTSLIAESRLGFMIPYFSQFTVVDRIRIIAVAFVLVQVVQGGLSYVSGRLAHYMQVRVERDLKEQVFDQVLAVDLQFIQADRIANLYTTMRNYPKTAARLGTEVLKSIPRLSKLGAYVLAMIALSWELSLLAMALVIVSTWMLNSMVRRLRRMAWGINEARVLHNHITLETLNSMKIVRLFAREGHARHRYRTTLHELQDQSFRAGSMEALMKPLGMTVNAALFGAIIVAATYMLDKSASDWVVLLMAFIFVSSQVMGPATGLIRRRSMVARALPSVQLLMEFLDRDDKPIMPDGDVRFEGLRDGIRFEDLHFRYGPDMPDVVRGVSFEVPRGATVALVGGSGAGKSTIINLLARLYDPTGGRITVDGQDLRELQASSWRSRIAVVSQDTYLFNTTVMENIRFGRLDATDEEVHAAARSANAHDFVEEMEEGYATLLGDRGTRLSGGQAQRIAIARAILSDPDVLVLDEATSALDAATERLIQEAIERVARDRTVVAIAHRLSTVRNADNIIVLEGGRIVEAGRHEELLSTQGHYWRYVQLQDLLEHTRDEADADQADEADAGPGPALNEPEPELTPGLRVIVQAGRTTGLVELRGSVLAPVPLVWVENGQRGVLAAHDGNIAVCVEGRAEAAVRVEDVVFDRVALIDPTTEGPAPSQGPQASP